jgi:muramoyltetrapeptide carboxypeptidase
MTGLRALRGLLGLRALRALLLLAAAVFPPLAPSDASPPAPARKPPALARGDTIGLLAPASPLGAEEVRAAEESLRRRGYRVKRAGSLGASLGYLAGSDRARAADLNELFADPEVKAIVCVRGGYGSPRLLDRIDYDAMRRSPKVLIGYSDITALLLAVQRHAGLVVFHGPMGKEWASEGGLTPFSERYFWPAVAPAGGAAEAGLLADWGGAAPAGAEKPFPIARGTAEGILTGGNLSVITALMGTPYEIDARGAILFLEDVGEKLFRIDRMLNQLRLAGKLRDARGIILGAFTGCEESDGDVSRREVFEDYLAPLGVPVLAGYPAGHVADQATLPFGVRVRLDASAGKLAILEPAVASEAPARE